MIAQGLGLDIQLRLVEHVDMVATHLAVGRKPLERLVPQQFFKDLDMVDALRDRLLMLFQLVRKGVEVYPMRS
jgi:hypothetical protein